MPGVLIIEGMAQAGGIMLLNQMDNPQDLLLFLPVSIM
jgi:3-hydroxymyristoyl/3-hydroxydecanoyl-(acyl carrier protein) dehydratase